MKKVFLLGVFLWVNLSLFAQSAPVVGAKWTYIQSSGFGENGNFYRLQVALDTTIDGKLCKKMVGGYNCALLPNNGELVHFDGKKAYRYDFRTRKFWLPVALFTAAVLPLISSTAHALTAGQEYDVIAPPIATADPKRIEVMELFFYGCPHCFALEPDVVAWTKTLPKNVYFRRVPGIFASIYGPAAAA